MKNKCFNELFSEFILNMERIQPSVVHPDITVAISDICRVMRVSYFIASIDICPDFNEGNSEMRQAIYFSEGEYDNNLSYSIKKKTHGGTANYTVFQHKEAAPWTDEEIKNIDLFLTTFFVFNGRAGAMSLCEDLMYHDSEFGVYNIKYLLKMINMLIAQNKISDYVCCRFNLRKFSLINRILGRKNGTKVMRRFSQSLAKELGENSYVCRLGGDNFLMIFPDEKMETAINFLSGTEIPTDNPKTPFIKVSARAGYFDITKECRTPDSIIDRTGLAFNMTRNMNGCRYIIYDDNVKKMEEHNRMIEDNFNAAIENEEFLIYYQPKVELRNYSLCGAEALCRWKHDGKIIPPNDFIPYLEQSSNICTLDMYMLEHVCRDIRRWLDNGFDVVKVSVNLSRVNLANPKLAQQIISIISKYDVPFEYIEIEITETTSEIDLHELIKLVRVLHEAKICTSIDDFGAGYSSINLIRDLPWDTMKIDRNFLPVKDEQYSDKKKTVLKHVISLAQEIGLECMVEGVETTEHVAFLKENNCYYAQGYRFDKPLPVEVFEERLKTKIFNIDE